jgi:hypothetical protein
LRYGDKKQDRNQPEIHSVTLTAGFNVTTTWLWLERAQA